MYLEQGALSVNPLLSSRAIMTRLTRKYEDAAKLICLGDRNQYSNLSADEILMLVRNPTYRVLLERSYSKLMNKPISVDTFFERLFDLGIDRESLLQTPFNPAFDLIVHAPFLTSIIDPSENSNKLYYDDSAIVCEIYKTFPCIFEFLLKMVHIKTNKFGYNNSNESTTKF